MFTIQDEAKQKIVEIEEKGRTLSRNELDAVFQSIVSSLSKSRYIRGQGYMARPQTFAEHVRNEVNSEIQFLRRELETERAERAKERAERAKERVVREAQMESLRAEFEARELRFWQSMREEFMALLANHSQVY